MTKEQHALLVELALAVHEMASPDRQRRITKAFEAMEHADRQADYEAQQETETNGRIGAPIE